MSDSDYVSVITRTFEDLDLSNFTALMAPPKIFICGGPMNTAQPESLRERIVNHLDDFHDEIYNARVIPENFQDYFKEGAYSNLLQFEEDIANISTLIIICLESAGSLVEFGLFCNNPKIAKKLLVFAPSEELKNKDSFIYLGPFNNLKAIDKLSVSTYPWPENGVDYDEIEMVVHDIIQRLDKIKKSEQFDINNTGHISLLIHDIVSLSEPIKITEIEKILIKIGFTEINETNLSRLLYLLDIMNLVKSEEYSHVNYYYAVDRDTKRIQFGQTKSGKKFDRSNAFISIRQSFTMVTSKTEDASIKKRFYAAKRIHQIREGK